MNSKERVINTLHRQEVDRIPMWMWYHPDIYVQFQEQFGWDPDTADAKLCNDIKQTHISINREMFRPLAPGELFTDDWGVVWKREGSYNQVTANPLHTADPSAIAEYRFPDADDPSRYTELARICTSFKDEYFMGADVSGSIFEPCYHIRGMDKLMVDMIENPEFVEIFFDHAADFTRKVCENALEYPLDWIWLGDDIGGQSAMMMSPGMWRTMLKPRLAGIIKAVKNKRPEIKIAYHSCGAIRPVIADLIEIGVDVLNPIQPLCPGMNPEELKKEFGDSLAFMGGLDTQEFLIHANPEEVRHHARELIDVMSNGGGYIFAASHTIQPDTPMENILALTEAVKDRTGRL